MAEGKAMSEFLPFSRPAMGVEELAAVKEVLESGWITTGPKNQALEASLLPVDGKSACHRGQFSHRRNAYHANGVENWQGR